jgi:MFS transporter, PAT family, solute carrier family 33 (acetyl-CoA transportor), member 1
MLADLMRLMFANNRTCFVSIVNSHQIHRQGVDGWALTMLQRKNVGHAGTCNTVGQTAGYFIGYVLFLIMESKDFCNKYVFDEPQCKGLVTLSGFLLFWGIVLIVTTILIAIFKSESSDAEEQLENHPDYGITKAYPMLWKIVKTSNFL